MEKSIKDSGGKVLWTPPYCPDLQPIELYLSAGKGNIPHNYYSGCSVKSTVSNLRYGWYGNSHHNPSGKMDLRVPEDKYPNFLIEINKGWLFQAPKKSIKCANDRVAVISGISGTVDGDLLIGTLLASLLVIVNDSWIKFIIVVSQPSDVRTKVQEHNANGNLVYFCVMFFFLFYFSFCRWYQNDKIEGFSNIEVFI